MPVVRFLPTGNAIEVSSGTSLLAAARRAGVVIEAPCDGVGTCGKCRVRLHGGLQGVTRTPGRHRLSAAEEAKGWVLACEAQVAADLEVEIPVPDAGTLRITSHGRAAVVPLDPFVLKIYDAAAGETLVFGGGGMIGREPGNTSGENFGLAIDIGTTTLVVALIDLGTGRELATASALNPQARHAQDVLSRIRFAGTEQGLTLMQREVIAAINSLLDDVVATAGVERERICEAVFSGNTCMLHLAAGMSPVSLGKYPYTQALTAGGSHLAAVDVGLAIAPFGLVYLPPVISAYVGADLTAGIQATGLDREKRTVLLIDIGTNGEMILVHEGRLYAASTAAGPAFEGMNIACGMRAARGAIERFTLDASGIFEMEVIGGGESIGICGSGLIDIVGELVRSGVVTAAGGFAPGSAGLPELLREHLEQREGKPAFRLSDQVYLGRGDVRQVQLAKGAIRAGIEFLLRHAGVGAAAIDQVLIAGSFGYHLRPESLLSLGLLPPECAGRIAFVGNTSKTGGQAFLLNRACRAKMEQVVGDIEVVELATCDGFERVFVSCLGF